jgi:hypothetical protein
LPTLVIGYAGAHADTSSGERATFALVAGGVAALGALNAIWLVLAVLRDLSARVRAAVSCTSVAILGVSIPLMESSSENFQDIAVKYGVSHSHPMANR